MRVSDPFPPICNAQAKNFHFVLYSFDSLLYWYIYLLICQLLCLLSKQKEIPHDGDRLSVSTHPLLKTGVLSSMEKSNNADQIAKSISGSQYSAKVDVQVKKNRTKVIVQNAAKYLSREKLAYIARFIKRWRTDSVLVEPSLEVSLITFDKASCSFTLVSNFNTEFYLLPMWVTSFFSPFFGFLDVLCVCVVFVVMLRCLPHGAKANHCFITLWASPGSMETKLLLLDL